MRSAILLLLSRLLVFIQVDSVFIRVQWTQGTDAILFFLIDALVCNDGIRMGKTGREET